MNVSRKMQSTRPDVIITKEEGKSKQEKTKQESIKESNSNLLDASSGSPAGLLTECRKPYSSPFIVPTKTQISSRDLRM